MNPTSKGNSTLFVTETNSCSYIQILQYTQPNDPPKSLPEIVTEYNDVTDLPGEGVDDQMPPLEDIDA